MAWVMEHSPESLTGTEQSVALALANYASDDDGGRAFPSVKKLMAITHWTERTVRAALTSLVQKGVIEVEREATNRLPTMYRFVLFRGAGDAPQARVGVQEMHPRGAGDAPLGVQQMPPIHQRNHQDELFDAFLDAYGPTNGAIPTTRNAWNKLSRANQALAMANLPSWLACEQWRNGYKPYPQKYLNGELYKRRPVESPKPSGGYVSQADLNKGGRGVLVT